MKTKINKGFKIQNRLINDTIYNHIEYTKLEDKILQTKIVNRLQFITQNALAYFSYPSITTKRFIHSLGTMHLSSFLFKNALLNADRKTKNSFLSILKNVILKIVKEENLKININEVEYLENKALFQFTIPTKSKSQRATYTIFLQTIRIVALLHDVGHLPFSHQVEYALKKVYNKIKRKELEENSTLCEKEINFKANYEEITNFGKDVLHEAIGENLLKLLFDYELEELIFKEQEKEYLKLIKKLSLLILEEQIVDGFDFKVLHNFIDSTVDADRLDYINRDMLASGYITGPNDHIRITKQAVLVEKDEKFYLSFYDMSLIDIEHMLEMRFNLYKKVIFNHGIAKTDTLLESVVQYLANKYFEGKECEEKLSNSISMLWNFKNQNKQKELDTISMLDENWLISLFKNRYFDIKDKENFSKEDMKYMFCFEEVLFGKRRFKSPWKNLNEFYKVLDFTTVERYKFRESFGYITPNSLSKLQLSLEKIIKKYEEEDLFFEYQIVSFNLGISKDFYLFDGEELINIDEISTLRKRLKHSMRNTVPFYIYSNKKILCEEMKIDLKQMLFDIFEQ